MTDELKRALEDAAKSLETIYKLAGQDDLMKTISEIRAYAYSRATVARMTLVDSKQPTFTTGHCIHKKSPGGCQLHNLHCGYPNCDRKEITRG